MAQPARRLAEEAAASGAMAGAGVGAGGEPIADDDPLAHDERQAGEEEEEEEEEDDEVGVPQQEEEMYESESQTDSGTDSLTWISWFCSLPGHEYFAEVAEEFVEDDFNLTGLNALVPFYKEALEMILDVEPQEDSQKIPDVSIVESSAELLYGLIHQRYILTRQGLQQMVEKYESGHFGYCPRVFCHSHPVLPCGRSDLPGLDTVKLFCANCIDNYSPPSSRFHGVDGAFFGTTFPHLLFQSYRDLAPSPIAPPGSNSASLNPQSRVSDSISSTLANGGEAGGGASASADASSSTPATRPGTLLPSQLGTKVPASRLYTPRIYGFRVSEMAKSGPRMRWMRMRPESFAELDHGHAQAPAAPAAAGAASAATPGSTNNGASPAPERAAASPPSSARATMHGRPIAGRGAGVGAAL